MMHRSAIVLSISVLSCAIICCAQGTSPSSLTSSPNEYRLPTNVIPISYKILLMPDLKDDFIFKGESSIEFDVVSRTNRLVLHAKDLCISTTRIDGPSGAIAAAQPPAINTTTDFLVIDLSTELVPGTRYRINLTFEGKLNDDSEGFYRTSYIDDNGKERWSAVTHFEPSGARRAFPCWDEPHLRATFDISIKYPKDLRAISNMPGTTLVDPADATQYLTRFEPTPKMSTYLVAVVVTDYIPLSARHGYVTIWVQPGHSDWGKFVLQNSGRILEEIEDFTGIPYLDHGFQKIDVVPLLTGGALGMENWGLITISQPAPTDEEDSTEMKLAYTLVHEFIHQWFGNLVSPAEWRYVWLSEGFAYYLHYVITDKLWPQWRLRDFMVLECLHSQAFISDRWNTSVSMNYPVYSPTEINDKFFGNTSPYFKAVSIIRMIHHLLGKDMFQRALQRYLQKMKYKAATSDDVLEQFAAVFPDRPTLPAAPLDILRSWADTPGFPIINVTRDYKRNIVTITQERSVDESNSSHNETYYVPINYATQERPDFDNTTVTHWMDKKQPVTEIYGNFNVDQWVIFNKQQFGYYWVNYDERNWKLISNFLVHDTHTKVHVLNRAQLVHDAIQLASADKLRWDVALDVLQFLKHEVDPVPWHPALRGLEKLHKSLAKTKFDRSFQDYVVTLTEKALKNWTLAESPEDSEVLRQVRRSMAELACYIGSATCREEASRMIANGEHLKMNKVMKSIILRGGIRDANQTTLAQLFEKYTNDEGDQLLGALTCSSHRQIVENMLKLINETQRTPDSYYILFDILDYNEDGVDIALDFINTNAAEMYKVSGNDGSIIKLYLATIGSQMTNETQLEKLETTTNEYVKLFRGNAIKYAQQNLNFLKVHSPEFARFFQNSGPVVTAL